MFFTLALTVLTLVVLYFWLYRPPKRYRDTINQIPGPKSYPVLGSVLELATGHEGFAKISEYAEKYRPRGLYRYWIGNKPLVVLIKPEYIEVVLRSSKHNVKSDEYEYFHPWLGTGLLTSNGEKWRHRRKMLTPSFHFNILFDFIHVFNKQSHVLVNKLKAKCDKGQFDMFKDISHCALDIICESAMGQSIDAQSTESKYLKSISRMSHILLKRMRTPWYWSDFLNNMIGFGKEQAHHMKILHDFTNSVIAERLRTFDQKKSELIRKELSGENTDENTMKATKRLAFLDMLLYMSENLTKLSMEDIREEVDTFMFEGHDTTGAGMSWAIYLLGLYPEAQAKLHEELDSVFGNDDRDPTMEDLKNLKYIECCLKESLRIYPSVPEFSRRVCEDIQLGEYTVPEGITVTLSALGVLRDPDIYPEPDVYKPERFFPENARTRHPYAYIPFSAGPRNCIGQKFALLEEKTVLAHIFRNFTVKSMQKRSEVRPMGDLILRPEKHILVELIPRK